jgi:SAM-dependent methyltransferase
MLKPLENWAKRKITTIYENRIGTFFFKQKGFCPCCEQEVTFISKHQWLRDNFRCGNCYSIPRERALMLTIKNEYPTWQDLKIHESSPGNRGHSALLRKKAKNYIETQFFPNQKLGSMVNGVRCEDLEQQTFPDADFDLVISSDVMEHIYDPEKAFKEIYRTLKPGGAHIFSVPIINKHNPTQRWATKGKDGAPVFLFEPEWHGNPVDKKGSPVTMHWGYDIVDFIKKHTGAETKIVYLDDLFHGIRAEYIEIVVMRKLALHGQA